jgi:hypothetical protein
LRYFFKSKEKLIEIREVFEYFKKWATKKRLLLPHIGQNWASKTKIKKEMGNREPFRPRMKKFAI